VIIPGDWFFMKQEEDREWLAVSTWLKGFIQSSAGYAFATIV
jgi:hypothetical protein